MVNAGGIGTYLQNLVPAMAAARPQWTFTLLGNVDEMRSVGWDTAPNASLKPCSARYYSVAEQLELPLRVPAGADVFWAPHYAVSLLERRPLVVTVHDLAHLAMPQGSGGWLKRRYASLMFSRVARAAGVAFVSDFSRREMDRLATRPRGVTAVTPLAVSDEWFRAGELAPQTPLAQPYIVYVGNWKTHKNLPMLLRAFGRVASRIPHRLVLVGRQHGLNADPGIEPAVSALGGRAMIAGEVSSADVLRWVAHADALVTVSRYEGFGLPPLEAMAAGRPCLVSNVASLPETCGDAALYCDPANEQSIADGLIEIATNAMLRASLVERGRRRAREFSWQRCVTTTLGLLEAVVS